MHRKSQSGSSDASPGRVPRLAERLLRRATPEPERDAMAGDLEEEYRQIRAARGAGRARIWYWSQVARSLRPGMQRPSPPPVDHDPRGFAIHGGRMMPLAGSRQDLQWALRGLAKSPGFTTISVLTLALAIGVNSAIFSMVGVLFFADLPITQTDDFAFFWMQNAEQGSTRRPVSMFEFVAYRDGVPALQDMAAIRDATAILTGAEEPLNVAVGEASPGLWEAWGTLPQLGRGFRPDEAEPGAEPVVVLSHGFWQRHFGADPQVVGRRVRIDGADTTIIGVMPAVYEFADMARIEIWRPLPIPADLAPSSRRDLFVTARVVPGATLEQASEQGGAVARRLASEFPQTYAAWSPQIQSFGDGVASDDFWPIMTLLAITVGFVMLMACSNIASMMLARGTTRAREIAVRAALGAGRLRIVRGLLTEGAVLAIAAGLLGLAVTRAVLSGLLWIVGDNSNVSFFFRMIEIDRNVLAFTVLVAALSPLLFSLLPALRVTRSSLVDTLKGGGGRGASGGTDTLRARRVLVAGQVALALSLMLVAGVMMRSLVQVRGIELGYDTGSLLTLRIALPDAKYAGDSQRQQFFRDALARVRALPEVAAAAWVSSRPIADPARVESFQILGREREQAERAPWTRVVSTEPAYFDLVNVRLLRGRMIGRQDAASSLPVVLIDQDVVTRYWPDEDPVGQHVRLDSEQDADRWLEIIGVVSSLPQPDPSTPSAPTFYLPFEHSPLGAMALVARSRGDTPAAANAVRRAIWAVDADQPIADMRTMKQVFDDAIAPMDAIMSMFSAFAGFALLMAAAGIYGVMSVLVTQRTREFGIRMALGADRRAVGSMVMRGSAVPVLGGAVVGVLTGYALSVFLASAVTDVEAANPLVFAVVTGVLTAVAFVSLWLPTRRATRVDPLVALRTE